MPSVYEGLAAVTALAGYVGQPPIELITFDQFVRVSIEGSDRTRIELRRYLRGPKNANTLRLLLADSMMVQGRIIDGCNEPLGGWFLLDVSESEPALEEPANQNGWQWE